MNNATSQSLTVYRLPQVIEKVGIKKSLIYAGMAEGWFPQNFSISGSGRAKGWTSTSIETFIVERLAASRNQQNSSEVN
jgi:predicted DNA-binding transcriptional regulator AlpA